MARLGIKGVFVRNRWDFFETDAALTYGQVSLGASAQGLGFTNNVADPGNFDIFKVETAWSTPTQILYVLWPPGTTFGIIPLAFSGTTQLDPNMGGPAGVIFGFSSFVESYHITIKQRIDKPSYDTIELANGGPFITLPPNWTLGIINNTAGAVNATASIYWALILDQIRQPS